MSRDRRIVKISKYLAKHLRHRPERLGIDLDEGGWVRVDELLAACEAQRFPVSREELEEVVARNDKQRFSFDEAGTRIRANHGHSVAIELDMEPTPPPGRLFHGTATVNLGAIWTHGIRPMRRSHVHLSSTVEMALRVGSRHGRPAVLVVLAAEMVAAGHTFFRTANGIWLTDAVPALYLRQQETE